MKKIKIHTQKDFEGMRVAGKLAAETLDMIGDFINPNITTDELNSICDEFIRKNGGTSAPLGYHGFPKSICTSINEVVCHGIPSNQKLKDGDIINIDVTPIVDDWHGDSNRTYLVGESFKTDPKLDKAKRLTLATYRSMMKAIKIIKPGVKLSEIGKTIQNYVHQFGFSVVRDYCGHGIGKIFHSEPSVAHYYNSEIAQYSDKIILEEGMIFTIEPMINAGTWEVITSKSDSWTVTTKDKKFSAQFEHTIGVTKDGYEIFTSSPKGFHFPKLLESLVL